MDWQTILTTVLTSTVVVGAFSYLFKKSFEKWLDTKVQKIQEQNRALVNEEMRRTGHVYDEQYDVLKLLASLSYRLRNSLRELILSLEEENPRKSREILNRLNKYQDAFVELLLEERLILPESLFHKAHDLKSELIPVIGEIAKSDVGFGRKDTPAEELRAVRDRLRNSYVNVDNLHRELINTAQSKLGLEREQEPRRR